MKTGDDTTAEIVKLPKRTRRKTASRLAESHAEIAASQTKEIDYLHTVMCQTSLPYKAIKERHWEQRQGSVYLRVEAGCALDPETGEWVELPIPFGEKPRILLMYLDSRAKLTGNPEIDVDGCATVFVRNLGLDTNGPSLRRFKAQMAALAASNIRMAVAEDGKVSNINSRIISEFDLWHSKDENQRLLWPSTVRLSQRYFDSLQNHAVPLDHRAISALAGSSMALDVYAWLAQRLHRVPDKSPQAVSWAAMWRQFGSEYKEVRFFRRDFLEVLRRVVSQYPEAKIEVDDKGLILHRSHPPVAKLLVSAATNITQLSRSKPLRSGA